MPPKIANSPELLIGLELFYNAFFDLTTCRSLGYGIEGPINWVSIDEYCKRQGISGEQREDLIYHIQMMDSEYLKFRAKKQEAAKKNGS